MFCFPRLTEMGIESFWDTIDITKKESLSIRDQVKQMPPVDRVRCLEALMAEIEATPPPESLRHRRRLTSWQSTAGFWRV